MINKRFVILLGLIFSFVFCARAVVYSNPFTVDCVDYGVINNKEVAVIKFHPQEKLTSFSLPSTVSDSNGKRYSVTVIASSSFAGALASMPIVVDNLSIPSTVKLIEKSAFKNNVQIKKLKIGGSAVIDDMAFYKCTGLKEADIVKVASIGEGAFDSSGLTTLRLPKISGGIEKNAFRNCENLKKVTIDNGVTSLPSGCFQGCPSLDNVTIPQSITELPEYCFSGCTSLRNIKLHSNLAKVGNNCFSGCTSLTALPQPHYYSSGDYAFSGCTGLKEVKVKYTGRATFSGCVNITKAVITGYTGPYPLTGCKGIKRLDIMDGSLGQSALSGMENLKEIYCHPTKRIPTNAEYYYPTAPDWVYENVTLYVPEGCEKEYITDGDDYTGQSAWKYFKNISATIYNPDLLRDIHIPDATIKVGEKLDLACEVSPAPWKSTEFSLYSDDIFTVLACGYDPGYSYWSPGYIVGQAPGTTTVHFHDANSGLQTSFKVTVEENPENPDYLTGLHTMTYSRGLSSGNVPDILPETFTLGLINDPWLDSDRNWVSKYSVYFSGILNPDELLTDPELEMTFDNGAVTTTKDVMIKNMSDDGSAVFWYWSHDYCPFKIYKEDGVLRMSDGAIDGWTELYEPIWSVTDQWVQVITDIHEVGVDGVTDIYRDDMSSCVNYRLTGNRLEFETSGDIYVYTYSGTLQVYSHSDNIVIDTPGFYIVRFNNAAFKITIP